jgi:moderate conductance mechanosensitive channel
VTMLDNIYGGLMLRQIIIAIAIVLGFAVAAWLSRYFIIKWVKTLVERSKYKLDNEIFTALQKPVVAVVIVAGFYIASLTLPQDVDLWSYITRGLATLLSLLGIFTGVILIDTLIKWYRQGVMANKKDVGFSLKLLTFCWIVIVLMGLWFAVMATLSIWGLEVSMVTSWLGEHGWRIGLIIGLTMLLILSMGEIVPRVVSRTLSHRPDEKADEVKKRSDTLSKVIVSTLQIFTFLIAIFMILSELEIDIAPILASAGVVGIAVGFGAQSLVKDIVAGLFIVIESQYRVGDVVKIASVSGEVENINLRRTVLRDLDGIVHTVPNGEIRVASNLTKDMSRVNLNISVGYNEDLDRVIAVINEVGNKMAKDPKLKALIIAAPKVLRVDKFGDSGIDIKIVGDTQPMRQWEVTGELRLRLKKAFDVEKIEIPWPHTKVYFGNTPDFGNGETVKNK